MSYKFKSYTGEQQVKSLELQPNAQQVYNIEVEAEHRYFVTEAQVLSHNDCPTLKGNDPQVRVNAKSGKNWENEVGKTLPNGTEAEASIKVTLSDGSTVRIRPDFLVDDGQGGFKIVEAKASDTAPFTTNQKKGYEELANGGSAEVRSKGKQELSWDKI